MANSVNFLQQNSHTSLNARYPAFYCSCGWSGLITELASHNHYICCPNCGDYDVRMNFDSIKTES